MACLARFDTLNRQPDIELGETGKPLLGRPLPDVAAGILYSFLDPTFLPAGGDFAEIGIKQIVCDVIAAKRALTTRVRPRCGNRSTAVLFGGQSIHWIDCWPVSLS